MTTELNVLKKISENEGKASVQLIARDLKLGSDYIRYICGDLLKKGLLKKLNSRDWYGISQKGEKELERREGKKDKKEFSQKFKAKKLVKKKPVKKKRVVSRIQPKKPVKKEKAEKQVRRKSIRKHTYKEAFEELEKRKKSSITSFFKKLFRPKRR